MIRERDVLDVVRKIYDAAGDPRRWTVCLASVSDVLGGTGASLLYHDYRMHAGGVQASAGLDPESLRSYAEYYHKLDPWALGVASLDLSPGQVLLGEAIVPHEQMVQSEFYADLGRPSGTSRAVMAFLERARDRTGVLSVHRSDAAGPFQTEHVKFLKVLVPHFLSALELHRRLTRVDRDHLAVADAFDLTSTATVLVNAHLRAVLVNRAASRILNCRDGLTIQDGQLRGATSSITTLLRHALTTAVAVAAGHSLERLEIALCLPRPSGRRGLQARVVPLPARNDFAGATEGALAALFFADPEETIVPPAVFLREVYGLTPAEARVALALTRGQTVQEVSDRLQLSRETVRAHLKHIMAKTDVRTQGQLVRLMLAGPTALIDPFH